MVVIVFGFMIVGVASMIFSTKYEHQAQKDGLLQIR
jgi:hypothetical protein